MKKGLLIVNLGTPDSPHPRDVYRYLIEFLTDKRVIDFSWLKRQLLVRGIIVPFRYRQSARAYQAIWSSEGSPLMIYGKRVEKALQELLGPVYRVKLAMRYQNPSLEKGIQELIQEEVDELIILPLFPQYASATTGSIHEKVMEILSPYHSIPKLTFINSFPTHPRMIEAFCKRAEEYDLREYDHFLFSFHGLPKRQILKADSTGKCLKCTHCCQHNRRCYSAQCYATAEQIAKQLNLSPERYSLSFQSRLGKDPWLEPFTSEVIHRLAKQGKKKVLVFCPAFVCDCLETIYEIGIEYAEEFVKAGGTRLDYVKGLNDHPVWIQALSEIVHAQV